ncbi:MAG: LacI family DNA-binding transcriptional regulator [Bacillota bacterium]
MSKSAVSIALNDKPGISVETRNRIMKIVRKLGYTHRSMVNAGRIHNTSRILPFGLHSIESGFPILFLRHILRGIDSRPGKTMRLPGICGLVYSWNRCQFKHAFGK